MDAKKRDWSKVKRKKAPRSVSIRLTEDEFQILETIEREQGIRKATYAKSCTFGRPVPKASRRPKADEVVLRQLLGQLGKLGSNANQIAKLCNSGTITDQREAIETLHVIKASMIDIRAQLLDALNVKR